MGFCEAPSLDCPPPPALYRRGSACPCWQRSALNPGSSLRSPGMGRIQTGHLQIAGPTSYKPLTDLAVQRRANPFLRPYVT
jgi:hypothetical protein